jgi:hypothetical protein
MGIAIMIGIVGVLALILTFQTIYGGNWSDISSTVAAVSVMIAFLAFAFIIVVNR